MKRPLMRLFLIIVFTLINIVIVEACKIEYTIIDKKETLYKVNDELIIEIKIVLTHRVCPVSLKETKFKYQGIEIVGATAWKQISAMEYTRKIKIKIVEDKKNRCQITASRTCDHEGGLGTIIIQREE